MVSIPLDRSTWTAIYSLDDASTHYAQNLSGQWLEVRIDDVGSPPTPDDAVAFLIPPWSGFAEGLDKISGPVNYTVYARGVGPVILFDP